MRQAYDRLSVLAFFAFAILAATASADDRIWPPPKPSPALLVYTDPLIKYGPATARLTQPYLTLWIEALGNSQVDLQREAAIAIASAHRQRFLDCTAAVDALLRLLEREETHPVVKANVARALVTIDARQSSSALMRALGTSRQLASIAEPALARWDHKPMRDVWLERIQSGKPFTRLEMQLAVECLGVVREARAASKLEQFVRDRRQSPNLRIAAAKAMGSVHRDGLEALADELFKSPGPTGRVDRLAAVNLLWHHESETSANVLVAIGQHSDAVAAGFAWTKVLQREPAQLLELVPNTLKRRDAKLRGLAVQTLANAPSASAVGMLGPALNDAHPDVRTSARRLLHDFAENHQLEVEVLAAIDDQLKNAKWMGLEQAARLAGELDHEPASDRLLQLVKHKRPEVATVAAWALRKLDKAENLPRILTLLTQLDRNMESGKEFELADQTAMAHLFEALGQANYQPALELALKWVPKSASRYPMYDVRPSAVWVAGKLKTGSKDAGLANQLYARMIDQALVDPELVNVKYASAIAMGRIGSDVKVKQIRVLAPAPLNGPVSLGTAWAISKLTGEPMLPIDKLVDTPGDWFLRPIGSRLKSD